MPGEQITLVSHITPDVGAGADLRAHQFKFVQVHNSGVRLADQASGAAFVLMTNPNSGQVCGIATAPNVAKVMAGEAIARGARIEPMSASGLARGTLATSNQAISGIAWTSAAGSGELFSVFLV